MIECVTIEQFLTYIIITYCNLITFINKIMSHIYFSLHVGHIFIFSHISLPLQCSMNIVFIQHHSCTDMSLKVFKLHDNGTFEMVHLKSEWDIVAMAPSIPITVHIKNDRWTGG